MAGYVPISRAVGHEIVLVLAGDNAGQAAGAA